ncbi:T9SS type A sorting domain-containing protein [Mesoflavibacter zeaxanthinifaciens]|uniref:T9SS type A sorting domain-containing protein n=1 Tax=Mesoflavibacter zeaxanthinifaciens TaxID=393060 RepID=UPI003A8DF277
MKKLNLLILFFITNLSALFAQTYVKHDATGANDGTSWSNAYTNLQVAINNSGSGDQIWVAAGTYKPAESPDASASSDMRSWCFYLNEDIKLYGGFSGTESTLSERDFIVNETILSGEIGNTANFSDNSNHVFIVSSTSEEALLDGFTVTHGNAKGGTLIHYEDELFSSQYGGGISVIDAHVALKNLNIVENRAFKGGGIFYRKATGTGGAGMVEIENVTFTNNIAEGINAGGGILITNASALITNAIFDGNRAEVQSSVGGVGGGLALVSSSYARLYNPVFYNNYAYNEGSAISTEDSEFTLFSGTFVSNITTPVDLRTWSDDSYIYGSVFFNHESYDDVSGDLDLAYASSTYNASDSEYTNGEIDQATGHYTDLSSFTADEIFVDIDNPKGEDNIWRTVDDGLMPKNGSPLLEAAGVTSGPYNYDVTGEFRFFNTQDLGAYENPGTLGVNDVALQQEPYKIYPNPTSLGYINIEFDEKIKIEIFDIVGKRINTIYPKTKKIDVSNLNKGVYLVKISGENRTETKKIIIN